MDDLGGKPTIFGNTHLEEESIVDDVCYNFFFGGGDKGFHPKNWPTREVMVLPDPGFLGGVKFVSNPPENGKHQLRYLQGVKFWRNFDKNFLDANFWQKSAANSRLSAAFLGKMNPFWRAYFSIRVETTNLNMNWGIWKHTSSRQRTARDSSHFKESEGSNDTWSQ